MEKIKSLPANYIFQAVDSRQIGMMERFYLAADVDALLQAARALVEAVVEEHPYLENSPQGEKCPICQAIAAVDAIISPPHSSPPPADTGRA